MAAFTICSDFGAQENKVYGVCVCIYVSRSVMSDSLWPHGLQPARLFCPWNSPDKTTAVGIYSLLQGIFQTQGLNLGLLHCRQILYRLSHQGNSVYTHTHTHTHTHPIVKLLLGRKAMTNLDSIKKQRHHFTDKRPYSQSNGFFSSHVWMWALDSKESWALNNWCFWTVVLE